MINMNRSAQLKQLQCNTEILNKKKKKINDKINNLIQLKQLLIVQILIICYWKTNELFNKCNWTFSLLLEIINIKQDYKIIIAILK